MAHSPGLEHHETRRQAQGRLWAGHILMSDFYTPFVQDLIKQIAIVVAVVVVVIFVWKLAKKNP